MGSIPFSDKPIVYEDPQNGGKYFLRPPCGDTEDSISALWDGLPKEVFDKKKRVSFLQKNRNILKKIDNGIIDIILKGWDGKGFPEFPKTEKPSQCLRWDTKIAIVAFYNFQKEFTGDEIKK